jgi:hypothetical protein
MATAADETALTARRRSASVALGLPAAAEALLAAVGLLFAARRFVYACYVPIDTSRVRLNRADRGARILTGGHVVSDAIRCVPAVPYVPARMQ